MKNKRKIAKPKKNNWFKSYLLVIGIAIMGFLIIENAKRKFDFESGISSITGNAVAETGKLNPNFMFGMVVMI